MRDIQDVSLIGQPIRASSPPHDLSHIRKSMMEKFPETYRALRPRRYNTQEQAPIDGATSIGSALIDYVLGHDDRPTSSTISMVACAMARLKMPVWWLSKPFAEAVMKTRLPSGVTWDEVQYPLTAGMIVFPDDMFRLTTGECFRYCAWAKLKEGDSLPVPGFDNDLLLQNDSFIVCTTPTRSSAKSSGVLTSSIVLSPSDQISSLNDFDMDDFPSTVCPLTSCESEMMDKLRIMVMGTILALHARPSLSEPSVRVRGGTKKERHREEWSPNWIGRRYQTQREPSENPGNGISPRAHWRRGHFRDQPHGPQNSLRKTIWIDPILVGELI